MSVTPIQMVQALTSLANNGTVIKPYVISKIVDNEEIIYEGKREEGRLIPTQQAEAQALG